MGSPAPQAPPHPFPRTYKGPGCGLCLPYGCPLVCARNQERADACEKSCLQWATSGRLAVPWWRFSVSSLYAQLLSPCIGRGIANRKQRLHRYPPGRRLMNSTKWISGGLHERAMFGPPLTGGSPAEIKRDRRVMPPSDPSYAAHETPPWAMLLRHGQKKFPAARRRAFSASQASSRSRRSSSAFALNFAYSSALKFLSIASNRRASIPGQ